LLAARGKMLIDISDASKALETHQKSRRKSRGNQSRIARA